MASSGGVSASWTPRSGSGIGSPVRGSLYYGYLIILCVLFGVVWAFSAADVNTVLATVPVGFWVLSGLAVIVDTPLFALQRRGYPATVAASVSFTFALSYAWGHGTGRTAQTAAILVSAVLARREFWAVIFDLGRYGLALSAVGVIGALAGRTYPVPPDVSHLGFVVTAAVTWYLVFRLTTATEVWLRRGGSWRQALVTNVGAEALSAATLLVLSPMLIAIMQVNAWLIPLVLVPLYVVSSMSRLWYERSQRYWVDPLTGLASRAAIARETEREAAAAQAELGNKHRPRVVALLVIDLDQFRLINEALGYEVADKVLIAVGQRLAREAAPQTVVARLKGDEFGILLSHVSDEGAVLDLAKAVRRQFAKPVTVDGQPLFVDASIGVATCPRHGDRFDALAQHADAAMHDAKDLPDGVAMFRPEFESLGPKRWALLADLRRVLEHPDSTEIVPYYQPQIDCATGEVVGVEALLRWRHPTLGMVSPNEVVRAAEHSPIMHQITRRMIEQVLRQLSRWRSHGFTVRASVNVSVRDLYTTDLVSWLRQQLHRYGVPPGNLQLELTESALMTQPGAVISSLQSLQRLGVGASLDDFGTGFSSLQHVHRLPLTEIKIDRSFIQSMVDHPDAEAIVRATIDLAGNLGLRVIAEGVDNEDTRQRLLADGCHIVQGFYYAKPAPVDEFDRWLAARRAPANGDAAV